MRGAGRGVDRVAPVDEVLTEARRQKQGVVDADAQADHAGEGGGRGREGECGGDDAHDAEADPDADERGDQREQGGEGAAEGQQQDDQGGDDAYALAQLVVGRRPDHLIEIAAVGDAEPRGPGGPGRLVQSPGVVVAEVLQLFVEGDGGVRGTSVGAGDGR